MLDFHWVDFSFLWSEAQHVVLLNEPRDGLVSFLGAVPC